jgi:hypothetical protein
MSTQSYMSVSAGVASTPPLPVDYHPFKTLFLCSNRLDEVQVPILFRNVPLLLVGSGPFPLVWLAGPTDAKRDNWRWVVEKSIARSNLIKVEIDASTYEVRVLVANDQLLAVRGTGQAEAEVTALNLKPMGILAEGSSKGLLIGGQSISRSTFVRAFSAISLS